MTATNDISITTKPTGLGAINRTFLFRGCSMKPRVAQGVIPFPLVNQKATSRLLFRFSGQELTIAFSFVIYDSDEDMSDGTASSVATTVAQQVLYVQGTEFFNENFSTNFTLTETESFPNGVDGVIIEIELDKVKGNPTFRRGTCVFSVGDITPLS